MPQDQLDDELDGIEDTEGVEGSDENSSEEGSEGEDSGASEEAPEVKPKKAKKSSVKKVVKASEEESEDEEFGGGVSGEKESAVSLFSKMEFGDVKIIPGPGTKTAKARNMLKAFASSPLVVTVLPVDYLNPHITTIEFQMQGLVFSLPLGDQIQVPQIVEQFIRQTVYGRKR